MRAWVVVVGVLATASSCARDNPAFGQGAGTQGGTRGDGADDGTGASTRAMSASGGRTSGVADDATSVLPDTSDVDSGADTGAKFDLGPGNDADSAECSAANPHTASFALMADTFVTDEEACGASPCADASFTGSLWHGLTHTGTSGSVLLLRYNGGETPIFSQVFEVVLGVPVQVGVQSGTKAEVGILNTPSMWMNGDTLGTVVNGEPTWNNAAHPNEQWRNSANLPVANFSHMLVGAVSLDVPLAGPQTIALLTATDEAFLESIQSALGGPLELYLTANGTTGVAAQTLESGTGGVQLNVYGCP